MLKKPLREEQADMKLRWSDPSYQWANDSNLRRRYTKETNAKVQVPAPRHDVETTLHSSGKTAGEGENK
jgi:hypothetical protein